LRDAVAAELDFEMDQQQAGGSWHPFWSWGQYEDVCPTARLEWQGNLTVDMLAAVVRFDRTTNWTTKSMA